MSHPTPSHTDPIQLPATRGHRGARHAWIRCALALHFTPYRGHTPPYPPALPTRRPECRPCGVGLLTQEPRDHLSRGDITAGLTPARVGPWRKRPRGAAPLPQVLETRTADATQRRQGARRAAVCVRGTEDLLTTIEGGGLHLHACEGMPALNAIANRSR
jgi:hypothetical protein